MKKHFTMLLAGTIVAGMAFSHVALAAKESSPSQEESIEPTEPAVPIEPTAEDLQKKQDKINQFDATIHEKYLIEMENKKRGYRASEEDSDEKKDTQKELTAEIEEDETEFEQTYEQDKKKPIYSGGGKSSGGGYSKGGFGYKENIQHH